MWRDKAHLPKELIFELHYLGSVEYSFSLNFSRPAAPIIAQYFNLLHLGFEGYRAVALSDLKNARILSRALEGTGYYKVLSDIHRKLGGGDNDIRSSEEDVEVGLFASLGLTRLTTICSYTNPGFLLFPSVSPTIFRKKTQRCSNVGFKPC